MNFKELKRIARKENVKILREEINEPWVERKIMNHIERNNFITLNKEQIKNKILSDDLVASFFVKDPSRQNFTEIVIASILQKKSNIENFVNHSSNTNLFVVDGQIVNHRVDGIKSIDYSWETKGKKVYASQKYTKEAGGAQDNQYNDILNFLSNAKKNNDKDLMFFAIVDGDYYSDDRINIMRENYEINNVKICRAEEVEGYLDKI